MSDILDAEMSFSIVEKGSGAVLCDLPCGGSEGEWSRRVNLPSYASGTFDLNCCPPCWSDICPWVHELVIFRNGNRAWTGPILTRSSQGDRGQIRAVDRAGYLDRRVAASDHLYDGVRFKDAALLWIELFEDADGQDPIGLTPTPRPVGVQVGRTVVRGDKLGPHFQTLTDVGLDWTVIGDEILVGDLALPGGAYSQLTERDFEKDVLISKDGTEFWNHIIIQAQNGIIGEYPPARQAAAVDPEGLHSRLVGAVDIRTQAEADELAKRYWERYSDSSDYVNSAGSSLRCGTNVCVDDLIPGREFEVSIASACDSLTETMRLSEVNATWLNCSESSVALDLQPLGTVGIDLS